MAVYKVYSIVEAVDLWTKHSHFSWHSARNICIIGLGIHGKQEKTKILPLMYKIQELVLSSCSPPSFKPEVLCFFVALSTRSYLLTMPATNILDKFWCIHSKIQTGDRCKSCISFLLLRTVSKLDQCIGFALQLFCTEGARSWRQRNTRTL